MSQVFVTCYAERLIWISDHWLLVAGLFAIAAFVGLRWRRQ